MTRDPFEREARRLLRLNYPELVPSQTPTRPPPVPPPSSSLRLRRLVPVAPSACSECVGKRALRYAASAADVRDNPVDFRCGKCGQLLDSPRHFPVPVEIKGLGTRISTFDPDEHWIWTGATNNGYGIFKPRSEKRTFAHRYVYEHLIGPIASNKLLHHTCEIRACVNPAHLREVTPSEHRAAHIA